MSTSEMSSHDTDKPDGVKNHQMVEEEQLLQNKNDIIEPVLFPPPPDGGWGWVVTLASFMCNMILDGLAYTFGVLLNPLVEHFNSNRSTVSWVGSLLAGVYLTSGPIVGALVNKYGCRPVCISGSIVAALGIGLSIFSPNLTTLMISYGVVGGFGLGLVYLPAIVCVGYYFEKKRALATGISVCGSGVGTFLFAPLATFLLDAYGWQGANLIFAGLCLNCAVFGALMRPLELKANMKFDLGEADDESECDLASSLHVLALPSWEPSRTPSIADGSQLALQITSTLPPLPSVAEESVTAHLKEDHLPLSSVFPNVQFKDDSEQSKRERTTSESISVQGVTSRFQATLIKESGSMKRNSSAPQFPQELKAESRIISTASLRLLSASASERQGLTLDPVIFGATSPSVLVLQPRRNSRRFSRPIVRPLYRKDIFYSGSLATLAPDQDPKAQKQLQDNQGIIDPRRQSVVSIPKFDLFRRDSTAAGSIRRGSILASHLSIPRDNRSRSVSTRSLAVNDQSGKPGSSTLREMTNFKLLMNKYFMLIALSNIFGMIGFYVPFVYLPNMAEQRGISVENANFLLSIIGISNTVGRVAAGYFSDFPCVDSLFVTNVAILLSGISVAILPFCDSFEAFVSLALFFGLFVAAYISLTSIVLVDLLGLDNLTSAFGLLVLFRGISSVIGPPLAGFVYDWTQSYDVSFYMAGAALIISSAISFVAQILRKTSKPSA